MLVTDLAHFGLALVQNTWHKWQQTEDDRGLLGESLRSMVRIVAVDQRHILDVIVLHCVNKLLNEWLVQLESGEVLGWVLVWDILHIGLLIDEVSSCLDQFAHF